MKRASAPDMRRTMEGVDALVKAGINFVPIPILNTEHHEQLVKDLRAALTIIEGQCNEL